MQLAATKRKSLALATRFGAWHYGSAQLVILVNLPVLQTTLKPVLWLCATRSAAVRDASLSLWVSLDIVSFAVTLAVNFDRARFYSTLIQCALDIGSLFDLVVARTKLFEAHD
jgi:hypothetical protein